MSETLREFTQQQFSSKVTFAGSRLDAMLTDLLRAYNNVSKRHIVRRWVPCTAVGGYCPATPTAASQDLLPWLPIANHNNDVAPNASHVNGTFTATPLPVEGMANPWRVKGTETKGLRPDASVFVDDQLAWTIAFYFDRPVIITGVSLVMTTDAEYLNPFVYGAFPPPGKTAGDPVDDLVVELSVDNPFLPERRQLNDLEWLKRDFRLDGHSVSPWAVPIGWPDMLPVHPRAAAPTGIWYAQHGMDLRLHQRSRARLSFIIPRWSIATNSGWGDRPWEQSVFSWTMHWLEGIG